MGSEMQRVGDLDRDRYLDHVDVLYQAGYIRDEYELVEVREKIGRARSIGDLDRVLAGMPLPETPKEPRDWGIPRNWGPLFISTGTTGVLIAALTPIALQNFHATSAQVISALAIIVGIIITFLSIIGAFIAGVCWDDESADMKRERRARDPGW